MTADELFEKAALCWRDNNGAGTAFVPAPLNDKVLVYQVLSRMYSRSPTTTCIIIVENFNERTALLEFLTNSGEEENDKEFKSLIDNKLIRVFTSKFLLNGSWSYPATICIWYRPKEYSIGVALYMDKCKYKLVILNQLFKNNNELTELYKRAPILSCFKQAELDSLRVSTPVEDMWIDVVIPEDSEDYKLYKYYTTYIETSINIFGSFEIMQQARTGNTTLNISSTQICNTIAEENGWNEHLDMSYEYNQKIDDLYNPNALAERSIQTYEIIRNRSNLVSSYEKKLEAILNIVKEHPTDKILIINKKGEFANKVTEYLNNNSEYDICGNYHNKADDIPAVDVNGKPIYFKSGREKGKRKTMGFRAQMTRNEALFNLNKLNCLSLSNAPDKDLSVDVSVIIITSPLCEDIESYLYRLNNIRFIDGRVKLFSIFCKNTIEQQKIFNKPQPNTHTIINKLKFVGMTENKSDFIIVD